MKNILLCLALAVTQVEAPGELNEVARGSLVAVGGGGTTDEIRARVLELAGGDKARVVVLPQASSREGRGLASAEMWRADGVADVVNADGLEEQEVLDLIAAADLVWIPGGSQNRFMEAWLGTSLVEALRAAHERGAVVGGTSAGAAVLSADMITGDADLESVRGETTILASGLGLCPELLVDQHFGARRRMNRLLAAVLDRPTLIGVGVDERTAAILSADRVEVVGDGSVIVVDARKAVVEEVKRGGQHGATGVSLHVLRGDMRLELR